MIESLVLLRDNSISLVVATPDATLRIRYYLCFSLSTQDLSAHEEYQEHQTRCISKVKEIAITFLVQVDKSDKQVFIGKELDGILYRLVKVLSDDFLQQDKNKDDRRGLDSTLVVVRLKYH